MNALDDSQLLSGVPRLSRADAPGVGAPPVGGVRRLPAGGGAARGAARGGGDGGRRAVRRGGRRATAGCASPSRRGLALPATLPWLALACASRALVARAAGARGCSRVALGALAAWPAARLLALVGARRPALAWRRRWPARRSSARPGRWLRCAPRAACRPTRRRGWPELQARIRPHFLFNTLNSAIALVREDPARAEDLLEDLSELFRVRWSTRRDRSRWPRRSSWRAATWTSSRCASASGCASNGRSTPAPAARGAAAGSAAAGGERREARRRAEPTGRHGEGHHAAPRQRGGDQGDQHRAGRAGPARPWRGAGQRAGPAAAAARRAGASSRRRSATGIYQVRMEVPV